MPGRAATEYRYEKLTWPEINDAVELGKVCILPCSAVEQHGPQHHRFDAASFRRRYEASFGMSLKVQAEGWA